MRARDPDVAGTIERDGIAVAYEVFGDAGTHVRSAVGVASLPLDAPVEVEIVVEVAGTSGAAS